MASMTDLKPTDIAAWWGACVATAVFVWDIYKWRLSGARLRLTVSANMEPYGSMRLPEPTKTIVIAEVANVGNKKTTITHVFAYYYANWWKRLLRLRTHTLIVPNPVLAQPLPFELEPGARWVGAIEQNGELEEMSRKGCLLIGVLHSVSKAPVMQRLVIGATL